MGPFLDRKSLCICLLSIHLLASVAGAHSNNLGRSSFPKGFMFGIGSAAYQFEGAAHEHGKGPSIWDTFSHIPGKIVDGSNGDVAVDQYHRYKEDVKLIKEMGMDSYRLSISWPRIFPKGSIRHGKVNKEGVRYYNNLINELLKYGIKPFVTLYHWDLPQSLQDEYGGFLSSNIVEDFVAFAEECFRAFGDRVKHWVTLNEPYIFATFGFDTGVHAPGHCSPAFGNCTVGNSATEPYIVAHNMLLAHAAAVKIYKNKYQKQQKGLIGIILLMSWMIPYSDSVYDRRATERVIDFRLGWYLDPLTSGKYPDSMIRLVGARLPKFSRQQAADLKGSFDFIGLNYYTTQYTFNSQIPPNPLRTDYFLDARANLTSERHGVFEGVSNFRSYAPGLYEVIDYTKRRYNNPLIFMTETGYVDYDNGTIPLKESLNDTGRIQYHLQHLSYVLQAIRNGANVQGYFAWALLDNFEWSNGYTFRYGSYYVDLKDNLKRYPKASAYWFKHFLKQ
eukprot:Gb_22955 [translate_table: standard]